MSSNRCTPVVPPYGFPSLWLIPTGIHLFGAGSGTRSFLLSVYYVLCKRARELLTRMADRSTSMGPRSSSYAFKMFEINDCCVCCSKAQQVLVEVQMMADFVEFDCCIIEACAAAYLAMLTSILSGQGKNKAKNSSVADSTVANMNAADCLAAMAKK